MKFIVIKEIILVNFNLNLRLNQNLSYFVNYFHLIKSLLLIFIIISSQSYHLIENSFTFAFLFQFIKNFLMDHHIHFINYLNQYKLKFLIMLNLLNQYYITYLYAYY